MKTCLKGYVNLWVKLITVSQHLAMFGGHWSSASRDIKYLICHMNLQNHVIEGSSNFMSGSSSWYISILPSVVALRIVVVEMFLVCHMIKQDHIIKGPDDYKNRNPSPSSHVSWPWALLYQRYNAFSLSRDLARTCDQRDK